jgi:hypothetical protein
MSAVAVFVSIAASLLSFSLILDLAAMWPIVVLGIIFLILSLVRGGIWKWVTPLVMIVWILGTMGLHLAAMDFLPSAVGDLDLGVGTEEVGTAQLRAGPLGVVDLAFSDRSQLLTVDMRRRGGNVGPAQITPLVGDGRAEIVLAEREDVGLYRFEGWDVTLGIVESWEIDLAASRLEIDTTGARRATIRATGAGEIHLAEVPDESIVEVTGVFDVTVPRGVGVVLDGEATTPNDWSRTDRGLTAPGEVAWTLIVSGDSSVTVSYRDP